MKETNKDPYNFEKIDGFLEKRKEAIGEKKQLYGKVYQKSKKDNKDK